jgi:hypothetical protein
MTSSFHSGRAAAVLILALSLVGGCSAKVDVDPAPTRTARPAAPPPSVNAADKSAIDGVWTSFVKLNDIYVKAAQTGVYAWNDDVTKRPLYAYAGGPYMSALERDLDLMREAGLVRVGTPQVSLRRVVSVSPTSIVIEACVDDTGTDTVQKATGKSVVKTGQNQRYPVTLRAGLYPDNKWRWVEARAERNSSC